MNLKSRLKPFSALVVVSLAASSMAAGCSDAKALQDAACCKGFEVGTDMTNVDFGVDAEIKGTFSAFANAASDLSAVATGSVGDITTACQNIALDLGADPDDASVKGKTGNDALKGWCALAKGSITANFGASGTLATSVKLEYQAPKCEVSVKATADCQASCSADVKCDIKANPPTCEGGTLSVECSGGCTAEANATLSCTGSCDAECKGSCKASGGVKVDCKGKCDGTCSAGAAGGATEGGTGIQADGSCNGQCDGSCTLAADAPKITCSGTCDGTCSGKCSGTAEVKAKCDGKCDADYTPLKCSGGELKGGCDASAECKGSCNASASAKASCTPPSVAVVATAKAGLSADGELQLQAAIASLEVNLPKLLVVIEARGKAFTGNLTAAVDAGVTITGSGKLGASGAVCGVLIASTIGTASENFAASLSAATSITAVLK